MKKYSIALAGILAFASMAQATDLNVKGKFASISATAIAAALPSSADSFSALAGQIGGVTLTIKKDLIDADTIAGSLVEVDGWRDNAGGVIGAAGLSGVRGSFEFD